MTQHLHQLDAAFGFYYQNPAYVAAQQQNLSKYNNRKRTAVITRID